MLKIQSAIFAVRDFLFAAKNLFTKVESGNGKGRFDFEAKFPGTFNGQFTFEGSFEGAFEPAVDAPATPMEAGLGRSSNFTSGEAFETPKPPMGSEEIKPGEANATFRPRTFGFFKFGAPNAFAFFGSLFRRFQQ